MAKHRTHSIAFKRQVVEQYLAGDTLHGLSRRHDLSRNLSRQCRLLSVGRSSLYHEPKGESADTLALMRRIDALFLKHPSLRRPPDGASPAPRRGADRAAPCGPADAPDGA